MQQNISKKLERKLRHLPLWEALVPETTEDLLGMNEVEIWYNNIYTVHVRRHQEGGLTHLSIKRNDKLAIKDWRHFQYIKNQLVGSENVGLEVYPAESNLVDTCNQYHMWVLENPTASLMCESTGRNVSRYPAMNGKQRQWEKNMVPKDIEEMEKKVEENLKQQGVKMDKS